MQGQEATSILTKVCLQQVHVLPTLQACPALRTEQADFFFQQFTAMF